MQTRVRRVTIVLETNVGEEVFDLSDIRTLL